MLTHSLKQNIIQETTLDKLSKDVLLLICKYLSQKDLDALSAVNKLFHEMVNHKSLEPIIMVTTYLNNKPTEKIKFSVKRNSTIKDLKKQIEIKTGLHTAYQRLFFKMHKPLLTDTESARKYNEILLYQKPNRR